MGFVLDEEKLKQVREIFKETSIDYFKTLSWA
jgi:hypothetical protein